MDEAGALRASAALGYYGFERPEVIALVPESARRILEVGCAAGACGARLKRERAATVVGIEYQAEAATLAAERLDRVITADVEALDFEAEFQPGEFDAILFADVLEHLRDPEAVLDRVRPLLAPGGVVIASIPNVRNAAVIHMLAQGDWSYQEAGLLDRTHIRFFTRREVQRAFGRTGYSIDALQYVLDQNHGVWQRAGRPTNVELGTATIHTRAPEDAEELFVYQFLIRAGAAPAPPFEGHPRPLVSVVIPARGQLDLTQLCVESLRANMPEPREIILIDNASSDETPTWAAEQSDITYLRNDQNLGFAAACNQGLAAARGAYVILLNNDTVVPPGWVDALLAPMVGDPAIGLTGPRSNWVSGPQICNEAQYGDDLGAMVRFAADWQLRHRSTGVELSRLVGFCLAVRREVIDRIGGLDERFGMGNFEDDDYCIRAQLAGFRCWLANDAYIHHWGSRTFRDEKIDYQSLMRANWKVFLEKWDLEPDRDIGVGYQEILPTLKRRTDPPQIYVPLNTSG